MKKAFAICMLLLISTACLQALKSSETVKSDKISSSKKTMIISEDPAKFVLQEEDLPVGYNFDIGWYQDLDERTSVWDDPEEGRMKLTEWGYMDSYINRYKRDFNSPNIYSVPFAILSKVSRYETSDGAKRGYDYQINRMINKWGYRRISSLEIGDEGMLLEYTYRVEDSDFSYYVVSFRYQNTIDSVLVLGYVGSPNQDEIMGLAKIIESRLRRLA